jgi:anti-sigma B factor antagonist
VTTLPQLTVITEQHGRCSVLKLLGELDACSADDLRQAVGTVLDQHNPQHLTMDLSALTFADCAGLSVLVWARNRLAERGHELVITGSQPIVRRLLTLTGLAAHLGLSAADGQAPRLAAGPPPSRAGEGAPEAAAP